MYVSHCEVCRIGFGQSQCDRLHKEWIVDKVEDAESGMAVPPEMSEKKIGFDTKSAKRKDRSAAKVQMPAPSQPDHPPPSTKKTKSG